MDVAFSPDLSLQLDAQPLAASGDFRTYRQHLRPRSFAFRPFASLRGNAVLRWEYRAGSELFLVWQQDRGRRDPIGTFDLGRSLDRRVREPGRHTFVLKVRRHLPL